MHLNCRGISLRDRPHGRGHHHRHRRLSSWRAPHCTGRAFDFGCAPGFSKQERRCMLEHLFAFVGDLLSKRIDPFEHGTPVEAPRSLFSSMRLGGIFNDHAAGDCRATAAPKGSPPAQCPMRQGRSDDHPECPRREQAQRASDFKRPPKLGTVKFEMRRWKDRRS